MQGQTIEIGPLVEQLLDLRDHYEQLLHAVRCKQRCMRAGDMDELQSWSAREKFLIDCIAEMDAQRRDIVGALAGEMAIEGGVSVGRIASRCDEPQRSRLLALAGAIRSMAEQVHQVNQINDAVTREILECFAQMQRQFTTARCDIGLYDTHGQRQLLSNVSILDAVG
jgi:flagellar biosynthesis/type III secretory pathway chaperone